MLSSGSSLISGGLIASVVSMLLRLRRSSGEQRQQLRLIALVGGADRGRHRLPVRASQLVNGGEQTWLAGLPLFVAYFLLPILFATAVLRYRLYDLDVIINRTVVAGGRHRCSPALGYTAPRGDRRPAGRGPDRRLLAVAARDRGGRAGLPAAAPQRGPAGQPGGLRRRGPSPTRRWRTSAADLAEVARPRTRCSRPSPRRPAGRCRRAGATATLDVPGDRARSPAPGARSSETRPTSVVPVRNEGRDLGSIAVVAAARAAACDPPTAGCCRPSPTRPPSPSATPRSPRQLAAHVAELDRTTRRARRVPAADHRGRRRGPTYARGGDRPRGAAAPGHAARRDPAGARGGRGRVAGARHRPAGRRHEHRAGGAARPHPRRLPDPAGPVRARAGAAVAARPRRRRRAPARRRRRWPAAVRAAGRGGRLLLLRRGRARRAGGHRHRAGPRRGDRARAQRVHGVDRRSTCRSIEDRVEAVGGTAGAGRRTCSR